MNDVGVGEEIEFGFRTCPGRFGNPLMQGPRLARPTGWQRLTRHNRQAVSIAGPCRQGLPPRPRLVCAAVIDQEDRQGARIVLAEQAVEDGNDRILLVASRHDGDHWRPTLRSRLARWGAAFRAMPEAAVDQQQIEPRRY